MALKAKTELVQIRVDPQLLAAYQAACDYFGVTVSAALRSSMALTISNCQRLQERDAERAEARAKRAARASKKDERK